MNTVASLRFILSDPPLTGSSPPFVQQVIAFGFLPCVKNSVGMYGFLPLNANGRVPSVLTGKWASTSMPLSMTCVSVSRLILQRILFSPSGRIVCLKR